MRTVPLLLVLAACGRLGPFTQFREDTGDTADTGDTGFDTETDDPDTNLDTAPPDTGVPTREGVYNGTFTMDVTAFGFLPIDSCVGAAQIVVTTSSASGAFDCPFQNLIGQTLGPQSGEVSASVSGGVVVDPFATMGITFVFDELSGSFQGTTGLRLSESGIVTLDGLGDYDYAVEFDVRK